MKSLSINLRVSTSISGFLLGATDGSLLAKSLRRCPPVADVGDEAY
jgi:hypothetical protein